MQFADWAVYVDVVGIYAMIRHTSFFVGKSSWISHRRAAAGRWDFNQLKSPPVRSNGLPGSWRSGAHRPIVLLVAAKVIYWLSELSLHAPAAAKVRPCEGTPSQRYAAAETTASCDSWSASIVTTMAGGVRSLLIRVTRLFRSEPHVGRSSSVFWAKFWSSMRDCTFVTFLFSISHATIMLYVCTFH